MSLPRSAVLVLLLAVALAMGWAHLPRPSPRAWPMPWVEITPRLSGDGRLLVVEAQRGAAQRLFARREELRGPAGWTDVYLYDLLTGQRRCLSQSPSGEPANGPSTHPQLDSAGRWAVFTSEASNLVEVDRNGCADVFAASLQGEPRLVRLGQPQDKPGAPADLAAVSDGGVVVFSRYAGTSRELVYQDLATGRSGSVMLGPRQGPSFGPASFAAGTGMLAVSVFAPLFQATGEEPKAEVVGLELNPEPQATRYFPVGMGFSPSLAAEFCAFVAPLQAHYQVFLRALGGKVRQVTAGAGDSLEPALSADGRWLAFTSYAEDLAGQDTNRTSDVFLWDRQSGALRLLSRTPTGRSGNAASYRPSISADGSRVAFVSLATDLEATPARAGQVYLWERGRGGLTRL